MIRFVRLLTRGSVLAPNRDRKGADLAVSALGVVNFLAMAFAARVTLSRVHGNLSALPDTAASELAPGHFQAMLFAAGVTTVSSAAWKRIQA